MPPLVSVVIPTFNRRSYIMDAVESVLDQTYKNVEVIVVDDGSTDGTLALLQSKYHSDARVICIWQENSERAVARNAGIKVAKGEYVGFLDSDDIWYPSKLEEQLACFDADSSIVMVHSGFNSIDVSGNVLAVNIRNYEIGVVTKNIFQTLVFCNVVASPTPVVKRDILLKSGLFSEMPELCCFEDWEMWARVSWYGNVDYVAMSLAGRRLHPGNTERPVNPDVYVNFGKSLMMMLPKTDQPYISQLLASRYWDFIYEAVVLNKMLSARKLLVKGCLDYGKEFIRSCKVKRWVVANIILGPQLSNVISSLTGGIRRFLRAK